jgi:hypothetical protein
MAFEPIFKMFYKVRKVGKKTGQGTVYVVYRFGQSEMVKTTGVNVLPGEFNATTGKVSRKNPLHPELNAQIQTVVARLERAVRNARGEGLEPTTAIVDVYYAKILAQEPTETSLPGLQYGAESVADLMLQELKSLRESLAQKERAYAEMTLASNLVVGTEDKVLFTDKIAEYLAIHPSYRPATIAGYQDLANMLSKFQPGLSLTDVNLTLLQDFQAHLLGKELRN